MAIKSFSRPDFEQLVSPGPDRHAPIYNWHSFKHSYSRKLVESLVAEFRLKKGSWVLDPFCGGGTTLLSSKQLGMNSRGVDILPFSVFLSNVKVESYDERELFDDLLNLRATLDEKQVNSAKLPSDIELLKKAFSPAIRKELLRIKTCINLIESEKNKNFFNLGFLSTLESVSNTSKDGGFLRLVDRNISHQAIAQMFWERCSNMFADVLKSQREHYSKLGNAKAVVGDARQIDDDRQFDAVITSPPYPNRHDYTRIYALELAFDFISGNQDLKNLRYKTLRSHVEARKQLEPDGYKKPKQITELLNKVKANGLNNVQVVSMLEGYFEDMYLVLGQMRERLKKKGKIALVVSNVRFSGINIPVDRLLAQIGVSAGLKSAEIWTARNRGNSAQQMRDYSRKTSRESIVVWSR